MTKPFEFTQIPGFLSFEEAITEFRRCADLMACSVIGCTKHTYDPVNIFEVRELGLIALTELIRQYLWQREAWLNDNPEERTLTSIQLQQGIEVMMTSDVDFKNLKSPVAQMAERADLAFTGLGGLATTDELFADHQAMSIRLLKKVIDLRIYFAMSGAMRWPFSQEAIIGPYLVRIE